MRYLILACFLLGGLPSLAWAQGDGANAADPDRQASPAPPPGSPGDPDALLLDLFSDQGATRVGPAPALPAALPTATPGPDPGTAPGPVLNLPNTPSPVATPASPGEAVIERAQDDDRPFVRSGVSQGGEEANVAPLPSLTLNRYQAALRSWVPPQNASPASCSRGYLPNRPLYDIRCLGGVGLPAGRDGFGAAPARAVSPVDIRQFP
ncbi:MAG: hypothetical protein LBO66_02295 [Deltaproteobacteria bacterium]|jgi:hypothetical protein|nr:hypothetical protein [Deltaproteobacteria bacterium]